MAQPKCRQEQWAWQLQQEQEQEGLQEEAVEEGEGARAGRNETTPVLTPAIAVLLRRSRSFKRQ